MNSAINQDKDIWATSTRNSMITTHKNIETISREDPLIAELISKELDREEVELNLIASENYTPYAVLEAAGSVLTNKYAEGYPGKRYYGGCQFVDKVEVEAIERCKELFGAEHANVQPHAGSQANMAVYHALLKPGETLMGMSLASGGHLTHGHKVNFSGIVYNTVQYGLNRETEQLDYDEIAKLAQQHKPKLLIAGASAYSKTIDFKRFAEIAKSVDAKLLVDMAHISGLVATGLHPSPVPYADCVSSTTHKTLRGPRSGFVICKQEHASALDRAVMPGMQGGPFMHIIAAKAVAFKLAMQESFKQYQQQTITNAQLMTKKLIELGYKIVSGGTDNHLFIVDLTNKNVTGLQAETALAKAGISVSRSCTPFDTQKPWITSGIRIGTPAITTRGMQEQEIEIIVELIDSAIKHHDDDTKLAAIKTAAHHLCKQFPIYQ